jgi:hypothetical protein
MSRKKKVPPLSSYLYFTRLSTCVVVMLLLAIGCVSKQAKPSETIQDEYNLSGSNWDRYRPVTLAEIKEHLAHFPENSVGMTVNAEAASNPYRIHAVYLSEFRTIPPAKLQLIKFQIPDPFTILFKYEVLVEAEAEKYWMPVQTPLIPYLKKELPKGGRVCFYIMAVGRVDREEKHDWVFIINEFQVL